MQHVAFLHDVLLALQPQLAGLLRAGLAQRGDAGASRGATHNGVVEDYQVINPFTDRSVRDIINMADQVIPASKDAELVAAYGEHEARVTGPGEHQRFSAMIDALEQSYPG